MHTESTQTAAEPAAAPVAAPVPLRMTTLKFKYVVNDEQLAHLYKLARITSPEEKPQSISDFMGLLVSEGIKTLDLQIAAQRKKMEDDAKVAATEPVKLVGEVADKSSMQLVTAQDVGGTP